MNAAPELSDRWGIALYPGLTDENGIVTVPVQLLCQLQVQVSK